MEYTIQITQHGLVFVILRGARALLTCLKVKGLVIHRYGKGILLLIIDADQGVL